MITNGEESTSHDHAAPPSSTPSMSGKASGASDDADVLYNVEDGSTIEAAKRKERATKVSDDVAALYTVEDGGTIADETGADMSDVDGIQRLYVRQGETAFLRFVTRNIVTLPIHFSIPSDDGDQKTLRCNGRSCVLCAAKFKPTKYSLLPIFSTDEQALRVLQFGRNATAGSLAAQVSRELKKSDYTSYVYQLDKGRRAFTLKVFAKIDPATVRDFGDEVLRDIVARGEIPEPTTIIASVDAMSNDDIIANFERVARRLNQMGVTK